MLILSKACFFDKQVKIQFPIGFLLSNETLMIPSIEALAIWSKWGVLPLIIHPTAIAASKFLIFLLIVTGISKAPGTLTILKIYFVFIILIIFSVILFDRSV